MAECWLILRVFHLPPHMSLQSIGHMRSRDKIKKTVISQLPKNLWEWLLKLRIFHLPSGMPLWSIGHIMPYDNTKMLYLHFQKIYCHTWKSGHLGLNHKVMWSLIALSHDFTWQIRKLTSPLPQDLWPKKLAGWWFKYDDGLLYNT